MRGSAPTVPFRTGPVPPELNSSPAIIPRRTRPAFNKRLPLQEGHSLTLSVMGEEHHTLRENLGGSMLGPFRRLGWCLYPKRRQSLWGKTKEWTPSLRAAEPHVRHRWPPVHCRLLQAALIAWGNKLRPRRAPQKTLKKVPVQVLPKVAPPLRVFRLRVIVWTACGHSHASGDAKMPFEWVTLPVQNSPLNAGDNPQLPALSAARGCSTISSCLRHIDTAWRPLPLVLQSCPFPGRRSSAEKNLRGTSPGLAQVVRRSGRRPLHYPTSGLWIETNPRRWSLRGRIGPLGPTGSIPETSLQWKRSVTCNGTRASAPTPSRPDRVTPKSLCDPVRVIMASILCHRVVLVTLFPHLTGGPIKNIAAASCHSAVGSDVTGLTLMYHCPECDPRPFGSEVNSTRLGVLLIICEGWGTQPSAAPLFEGLISPCDKCRRSARSSQILCVQQEILRRVVETFDTSVSDGSAALLRLRNDQPRSVSPTNAKAPLAPSTVMRLNQASWPTPDETTALWEDAIG